MQVYLQFEISSLCLSPGLRFTQNSTVLWDKGGTSSRCSSVETACQPSPLFLARAPTLSLSCLFTGMNFKLAPVFLCRIILTCFLKMVCFLKITIHWKKISLSDLSSSCFRGKLVIGETWKHKIHRHAVSAPSLYIILRSFRETNWNSQTRRLMEI